MHSVLLKKSIQILNKLVIGGWDKVFLQHGLDISAKDLRSELLRPLPEIDRSCPGFEDFSANGTRGIERGIPALSLVFHGLASPNVTSYRDSAGKQIDVTEYPTPSDLEVLENLVYGLQPPSLEELRARVGDAHLAIVIYAKEYRVGVNTVHRRHADMCYSRTGVSRVGTTEALFLADARGYLPEDVSDASKIRVLPCRFAAYVAALVSGDEHSHGPMRFISSVREYDENNEDENDLSKVAGTATAPSGVTDPIVTGSDAKRRFWIPLHKLFPGPDCLLGHDLDVSLTANHVNEKIRRVHLMFGRLGHDGGWHEPDLSEPPFQFTDGIAEFSKCDSDGPGLLVPVVHDSLVEIATYNPSQKDGEESEDTNEEAALTFVVPDSSKVGTGAFSSSVYIPSLPGGARFAPEYVHARFAVDYEHYKERDLNELPNVRDIVKKGGYRAKHVLDFTGDGWVGVNCPDLNLEIPTRRSAYSIVTPPDYFIKVKQAGLMEWWEQSAPVSIQQTVWPQNPGLPQALSDQRFAANIELNDAGFSSRDDTMTAIVGQLKVDGGPGTRIVPSRSFRGSMLTDGASGVFAPGWDTSIDQVVESSDNGASVVTFFTTHGLGSPFPEDAKLCAALSSYWPAVAPDITRTFQPSSRYATATPLLDATIGQADEEPWDGIRGPKIIDEKKRVIEYSNIDYGDYVRGTLRNEFLNSTIGEIDHREYVARTVAMARAYEALGATKRREKVKFAVYSFTRTSDDDIELIEALSATQASLDPAYAYRFAIFEPKTIEDEHGKGYDKVWVGYNEMKILFADAVTVLMRNDKGEWKASHFND